MTEWGQTNNNDERVSNTNGTLVQVKLGDDERKALKWLAPLLIAVGFNIFATIWLAIIYQDDKHSNAMWMALVYSEYDGAKAKLDAQGIHLKALPAPPQ